MDSEIRKILIKRLREYRFMPEELIEIEDELDKSSSDVNSGIKSKNKISRTTENLAIKLASNKKYQEIKAWKNCIDNLFISYNKNSLKWKFIQRRYVLYDTVSYRWNKNRKLKDIDIYKDLELEGVAKDKRTFLRMKDSIVKDLYKEAKQRSLI